MKIKTLALEKIQPYERNPRKNDGAVDAVAESIRQCGYCAPIVIDEAGVILAGHTRYKALKKLGWEKVQVCQVEGLSEEQKRKYRILDNKTGELAEWDADLLEIELDGLDFEGFDFGLLEQEAGEAQAAAEITEDDFDEDPPEEPVTQRGQVWQLGRHRLMCGDATSSEDVHTCMGGRHADICFTSPPYNMGASAGGGWESAPNHAMRKGRAYNEYSDDLSDDEYSELLINSLKNAMEHADDVLFNLGMLSRSRIGVINMLHTCKEQFADVLIWNKSQSFPFGMESQRGLVSHRCELIFCFNRRGIRSFSHPQWEKGTMINRIDTVNNSGNKFAGDHAAAFPVEFAAEIVKKFSADVVMDPFGGTGTTMIACEQTGRSCRMLEIDPHYCDVIIRRWEEFTGEKAVLLDE